MGIGERWWCLFLDTALCDDDGRAACRTVTMALLRLRLRSVDRMCSYSRMVLGRSSAWSSPFVFRFRPLRVRLILPSLELSCCLMPALPSIYQMEMKRIPLHRMVARDSGGS